MKFILTIATLLSLGSAHASYMATHCSNPEATVRWETGHNSNTLTYSTSSRDEAPQVIPFYDVRMELVDDVTIREERIQNCGYASNTRVYSAKAIIQPWSPDGEVITTEVICKTHINGRSWCPTPDREPTPQPTPIEEKN